jgi:tetratricopeptide (TPR) repeat protein
VLLAFSFYFNIAIMPAPSYRDSLIDRVIGEAEQRIAAGDAVSALNRLEAFRYEVTDSSRLMYETGLVHRILGNNNSSEPLFIAATVGDPTLAAAWYDLGEIYLIGGKLEDAMVVFSNAANLTEEHPNGWAGPYRMAEVAGLLGDVVRFEQSLEQAIDRGFPLSDVIAGDENWGSFFEDRNLEDVMMRIISVYGFSSVLDSWQLDQ